MKLWDKGTGTDQKIEKFTVGNDRKLDMSLAEYDIMGSMAHVIMLNSIGLVTNNELNLIVRMLKLIYERIKTGQFNIREEVEDIHSEIEFLLTEELGKTGKKIHTGRSRNDQVLLDLKLYFRSEIHKITTAAAEVAHEFLRLSEKHKSVLIPGYTHLQIAMPSSFGLWFGSWAESLTDDLKMLLSAYRVVNQNPLGSAAGYGTSFPINRSMTTELLGFESMNYNVVYAQMGRGKTERTLAFGLASMASTLSKFAMDACLFMNQNFDLIFFPDELTTGSSIMPHKKNPDVLELIRGKCNQIQALPNEISLIITNLTSGYHRDMQLLKENVFPAIENIKNCLDMTLLVLKNIQVNEHSINDEKYDYLFSVEQVNEYVREGMSFRDAYDKVSRLIQSGQFLPSKKVDHTHEGSIGNLCNDKISDKLKSVIKEFNFERACQAEKDLINYGS